LSKDLERRAMPLRRTIACHLPRSFLIVAHRPHPLMLSCSTRGD